MDAESQVPEINRAPAVVVGLLTGVGFIWLAFVPGPAFRERLVVLAGAAVFGALLFDPLLSTATTKLSLEGVSQRNVFGRVSMKWSEVEEVDTTGLKGGGVQLTLRGWPGEIVISSTLFTDSGAAMAWLAERMPRVWPYSL